MKRMTRPALVAVLTVLLALNLTGCGSDSSSGSQNNGVTISGVVTDPAISGAQVRLDSAAGSALAQIVVSAEDGSFFFTGLKKADLDGAVMTASGGKDDATGVDFTGLKLKGIYNSTSQAQFITPLTTLIVEEMDSSGSDYNMAKAFIAAKLGLDVTVLDVDPASNAAVQKISLQLSQLAAALRSVNGFSLVRELLDEYGTDWQAISDDIQASPDVSSAIKERIAGLVGELESIDALDAGVMDAASLLIETNRLSMIAGVKKFLKNSLAYEPADDSDGAANIIKLAEALWNANDQKGLSTDSAKFANMVRYVFSVAGIEASDLDDEEWALSDDVLDGIAQIAELDVIDHTIPLGDAELLQTAEQKRDYFYASDLSPYFRAQRVFDGVLDDSVTDDLFSKMASGLATNKQYDMMMVILRTQISQPYEKANAYQNAAEILLSQGEHAKTIELLNTSWDIFSAHLEKLGIANLTKDDANFMQQLAGSFRDAGELEKSEEVLEPLQQFLDSLAGTYSTLYAQIVTAYGQQADTFVEAAVADGLSENSVDLALDTIAVYAELVEGLAANGTSACYQLKGSGYVSLAYYYYSLNMPEETQAAVDKFIDLRTNNDCANTVSRTDTYVDDLAEIYAYLDDLDGYYDLMDTMVASKSNAEAAVVLYEAILQAKAGNVEDAINAVLNAYATEPMTVSSVSSQLTRLTNNGINRSDTSSYLALTLFNHGYKAEGAQVLDAAWDIASGELYNSGSNLSSITAMWWGCPKVAQLTYDFVDQQLGRERMQACIGIGEIYRDNGDVKAAYYGYTHLVNGLLNTEQNELALASYQDAVDIISALSGSDYITAARYILNYILESGLMEAGLDFTEITALQNNQRQALEAMISSAAAEADYKNVVSQVERITTSYSEIASGLQNRRIVTALGSAELASQIQSIRTKIKEVVESAQGSADKLASASNIKTAYSVFSTALSDARFYDDALALHDQTVFANSSLNDLKLTVAEAILAENDFKRFAFVARDMDMDGLPDFYEFNASEEDIANAGLTLDNDVDGDGIEDSLDPTPLFCEACAD